jgi:hypothetical protein
MSRYRTEVLQNGLLLIWDYACQWGLTYHRAENGKWQPHNTNAQIPANKHLLKIINKNV